jgi:hypothetical protein
MEVSKNPSTHTFFKISHYQLNQLSYYLSQMSVSSPSPDNTKPMPFAKLPWNTEANKLVAQAATVMDLGEGFAKMAERIACFLAVCVAYSAIPLIC